VCLQMTTGISILKEMKKLFIHIVSIALLICYGTSAMGAQYSAWKNVTNSGGESTIDALQGSPAQSGTNCTISPKKHILPSTGSENVTAPGVVRLPYVPPAPEQLPSDLPLYKILISHFPYPQFWPRDPSLT
ncbi:MAG TPA: hypothetical protein VK470_17785, partial [Bacteroidota bacterium]|nr:hypothetical protein [Bacteroidota bacterium]